MKTEDMINEFKVEGENWKVHIGKSRKKYPHRKGKFLKGPIPLAWIRKASGCGFPALKVGLALWFLAGLRKSQTVKLTRDILAEFKVDRQVKRRGLQQLENASLVAVERILNRNPLVTILEVSEDD